MAEIKFEINGRPIDPKQFGNAIEQAVLKQVSETVSKALHSVRCQEHGQHAQVTVKGRSLNQLSFEVSGCCQDLIDRCTAKLK